MRYIAAMRSMLSRLAILVAGTTLSACGSGQHASQVVREDDPALSLALDEPIMIDPDLASMNRANSAASLPSQDGSLPTIDNGPEIIAAARSDALELIGGAGKMRQAPVPRELDGSSSFQVGTIAKADCAERVQTTMQWAARLPAPFPVYPRGAVQEAAGTDAAGCSLRVINFVTPVPLDDVIDFYFTRAHAAGYSARRELHDGDDVLWGRKDSASYAVRARPLSSGNTEVDLVTSG